MGPHLISVLESHPITKALGLRGKLFMQILKTPFLRSITGYGRFKIIMNGCADDLDRYL